MNLPNKITVTRIALVLAMLLGLFILSFIPALQVPVLGQSGINLVYLIVCVCHAVTDSQVRQAVHNGVTLMRELREELNVASSCGRCACCARDILRNTLKEIGEREDFAQAA
jgi:bacterioferritin-associated ferredoxin